MWGSSKCTTFDMNSPMPTLLVIPSGVGCSIGGFAGDAIPSARLLAAASGCLITHPNVMNGASLYWKDPRIQYVEGYALDLFVAGEIALRPVRRQKVGLLLDAGIEEQLRQRHLQVADGCRASLGLDIGPVITTDRPLKVRLEKGPSGISWGGIDQPDSLLRAGQKLKDIGATAIAIVTRFPDDFDSEALISYRHGSGVDVVAGAEAVISHLLVRHLLIPCAHAPACNPLPMEFPLDARAAGEELGYTFLSSVLVGLSQAPDLVPVVKKIKQNNGRSLSGLLEVESLGALVVPDGLLGGEVTLTCIERGVPIVVVSNPGVLKVSFSSLGLHSDEEYKLNSCILPAKTYAEAAGLLIALREGINPVSLYRPLPKIEFIE